MSDTGAPKAIKQSSRKGKKAWRKNVDISTVETGLETVREEIAATGFVLYFTTFTGSSSVCVNSFFFFSQWSDCRKTG
jgi:hypothetical protein